MRSVPIQLYDGTVVLQNKTDDRLDKSQSIPDDLQREVADFMKKLPKKPNQNKGIRKVVYKSTEETEEVTRKSQVRKTLPPGNKVNNSRTLLS